MTQYQEFLSTKHRRADVVGFEPSELPSRLFPFQRVVTEWAVRLGRAAIFADTGTGKSGMQLCWADQICKHTNGDVLILAPLAVGAQTVAEGEKFGIPVNLCRTQYGVRKGINITNYDSLDKFDLGHFKGCVCDESSILKSFMGKTKRKLVEGFAGTPFKLCCTATPAPNDHKELGNHAEFLGIMPSSEMLTRWFINDTMHAGNYRLTHHGRTDFWRWVTSWAACFSRPSDLGFSDEGFILPPLNIIEDVVQVNLAAGADGSLFRSEELTATTLHQDKRLTFGDRAARLAELVREAPEDYWLLWCETNQEADELRRLIPEAVELRGSETVEAKERKLIDFAEGRIKIFLSKASICGFGMNFQHCHKMAFVSVTHKYESMYQAIRRCWRFGQKHPVDVHVVIAESEGPVLATIKRKQADHEAMKAEMYQAMRETGCLGIQGKRRLSPYEPAEPLRLPAWLSESQAEAGPAESAERPVFAYSLDGGSWGR